MELATQTNVIEVNDKDDEDVQEIICSKRSFTRPVGLWIALAKDRGVAEAPWPPVQMVVSARQTRLSLVHVWGE
jgi:hypothetical protein